MHSTDTTATSTHHATRIQALASKLRTKLANGRIIHTRIEADRVVFDGGARGQHSIDLSVSSTARVLAHWHGYLAANGWTEPRVGDRVLFPHGRLEREGKVVAIGPERARIAFRYKNRRPTSAPSEVAVRLEDVRVIGRVGGAR